jgi:hypothetical protein
MIVWSLFVWMALAPSLLYYPSAYVMQNLKVKKKFFCCYNCSNPATFVHKKYCVQYLQQFFCLFTKLPLKSTLTMVACRSKNSVFCAGQLSWPTSGERWTNGTNC